MRVHAISDDHTDTKVGRRSLVRTGVWAVPVVAVVAAAPAYAACSGNANLATSSASGTKTDDKKYRVVVTLRNTGGTTTGLKVQASSNKSSVSSIKATGWTTSGATAVAASQVVCNSNRQVTFTIEVGSNSSQTITLLFTTTNGGTYTFSFTA